MQIKFLDQFLIKRTLNYNKKNNVNISNKKNIYIFPTFFGFQLGFFLFFCLLASTIYQNNFSLLIFIILFFIFFISILLTFQNLQNISFSTKSEILVEQQHIEIFKIHVENHDDIKKINIHLKLNENEINKDLDKGLNLIEMSAQFFDRGIFNLPTLNCYTKFPFGIIKSWTYLNLNTKVFVYPKPKRPPKQIDYYMYDLNLDKKYDNFDFSHLDEYKQGDSLSKVAWKISSAKNKMFTKKFNSEKFDKKILIDFDKLHLNEKFEVRLQYCSYILNYCYDHEIEFAFKIGNQKTKFGSSKSHLEKILKKLCYVKDL